MRKLASACANDPEFADALVTLVPPENYRPDLETTVKAAGVESSDLVVVYTGLLQNQQVKRASADDLRRGYLIEDRRKAAEFSDVAYVPASEILESITQPGVYRVLKEDGTTAEMLAATEARLDGISRDRQPCCSSSSSQDTQDTQDMVLIDLSTRHSKAPWRPRNIHGEWVRDLQADETEGTAKPAAGQAYRVLNLKAQTLSEPIYVTKVESSDGVLDKVFYARSSKNSPDDEPLILNPDYPDYDQTDRILGSCCRFVPIASKTSEGGYIDYPSDLDLGDAEAMRRFVFEAGYKQAGVLHDAGQFVLSGDIPSGAPDQVVRNGDYQRSPRLSKLAATLGLMTHCGLAQAAAEEILQKAASDQKCGFYYKPFTKAGYSLNFNQWPELDARYGNEFNVLQEPAVDTALRVDQVRPEIQRHRVGDILPVGGGENGDASDLSTMAPMDIYNLSKEKGTSAMFEHGVVGSLVQTYDSMAMVDKYMPDLEQGLDKLGRLLFLFYWKPEDFSRAYGTDDQTQLENKLASCFKSLGDLVIELLRKNRDQDGTASLV